MKHMKNNHPLFETLRTVKGNQWACLVTEPLWSVPYNLFLPFVSVYMAAIGLKDAQIGMVASFGLVMQFLWSLLSGAIVDKYGRRKTMFVFGLLSWSIPCLIWAVSHGYWYFMIAVLFNSMWRVTGNSFNCLIVEDGDNNQLINLFTFFNMIGLIVGFISPVMGFFIDRFTLIPIIRVLYLASMIMITAKFLLQYRMLRESDTGLRRIDECRNKSLWALTFRGWNTFVQSFRHTKLIWYVMLAILVTCVNIVQATFWPLFITSAYHVSASMISVFPMVKAVTSVIIFLMVTSRIKLGSIKNPMLLGLIVSLMGSTVLLACQPFGTVAIIAVFFSAVCDAFAAAILNPLFDSLLSVNIPANERARVNSLITSMVLLISIPTGAIAGMLSEHNRMFPLVLNCFLIIVAALLVLFIMRTVNTKASNN